MDKYMNTHMRTFLFNLYANYLDGNKYFMFERNRPALSSQENTRTGILTFAFTHMTNIFDDQNLTAHDFVEQKIVPIFGSNHVKDRTMPNDGCLTVSFSITGTKIELKNSMRRWNNQGFKEGAENEVQLHNLLKHCFHNLNGGKEPKVWKNKGAFSEFDEHIVEFNPHLNKTYDSYNLMQKIFNGAKNPNGTPIQPSLYTNQANDKHRAVVIFGDPLDLLRVAARNGYRVPDEKKVAIEIAQNCAL